MLSKNKIKFIQSLNRKKTRDKQNVFLAEGNKLVAELFTSSFEIMMLIATADFLQTHATIIPKHIEIIETNKGIHKASLLKSPQEALAVIKKPTETSITKINYQKQLCLALDGVQDPGNLGTILRIANWFGIKQIICSADTVDVYNPKVVQSSMGAIFRVQTFYTNLPEFILEAKQKGATVYGTFMTGNNIYQQKLSPKGILIMGNEGNGISSELEQLISQRLAIPSFAEKDAGSESLNVAVATAICCSEFRR